MQPEIILFDEPSSALDPVDIALTIVFAEGNRTLEVRTDGSGAPANLLDAASPGWFYSLTTSLTHLYHRTALHELLDALYVQTSGPIKLVARTDDLHLNLRLLYDGPAMIFPDRRPTPEEILDDPDAVSRMSGWLLRQIAGQAVPFMQEDHQGVWLSFDS